MIHKIILPKIEPNMEEATIIEWSKNEGEFIAKGETIFVIETAKASIEIESEEEGYLRKIIIKEGETVPILTVVALMGDKNEELLELNNLEDKNHQTSAEVIAQEKNKSAEITTPTTVSNNIKLSSPAAKRIARENNVDLNKIIGTGPEGRIIKDDVHRYMQKRKEMRKILIIGAGDGGEVVANILRNDQNNKIIGFLDDNHQLWNQELMGIKVIGGIGIIDQLHQENKFDSLIISITSNMKVRRKIFEIIKLKGYSIINAIHPQAYINPTAEIGKGNIIGAFVHIGHAAKIGNNNLITAHCNIEHHNTISSHILFGPGVMTSGDVTIGNGCSFGAGVNIEPHINIGNNVAVASGSTVIMDLVDDTVIKMETRKF